MTILKGKIAGVWTDVVGQTAVRGPQGAQGDQGPESVITSPFVPLQPFSLASWTWLNQGPVTVSEQGNAVLVTIPQSSGADFRLATIAKAAGTVTYTLGFLGCPWWATGNGSSQMLAAGLALYSTSSARMACYGLRTEQYYTVHGTGMNFVGWNRYSPTSMASNFGGTGLIALLPGITYVRVAFTAAGFTLGWSVDGIVWYDLAPDAFTFVNPDRVGIFVSNNGADARMAFVHWAQT
jgi:hypothetical protein